MWKKENTSKTWAQVGGAGTILEQIFRKQQINWIHRIQENAVAVFREHENEFQLP